MARASMIESVVRLRKGSALTAGDLLATALLLENVQRVRSYGADAETEDSLSDMFNVLAPLTTVCKEIRRCILSEDEIAIIQQKNTTTSFDESLRI